MSRYYCHDDYEHKRDAERDARRGIPDRDYYDRYTTDACKEVYTEAYDDKCRRLRFQENLREEREAEERRVQLRSQAERERAEEYESQRMQEEQEEPQPDTCCECEELAVGYDDGSPYCASHYRSRPAAKGE